MSDTDIETKKQIASCNEDQVNQEDFEPRTPQARVR